MSFVLNFEWEVKSKWMKARQTASTIFMGPSVEQSSTSATASECLHWTAFSLAGDMERRFPLWFFPCQCLANADLGYRQTGRCTCISRVCSGIESWCVISDWWFGRWLVLNKIQVLSLGSKESLIVMAFFMTDHLESWAITMICHLFGLVLVSVGCNPTLNPMSCQPIGMISGTNGNNNYSALSRRVWCRELYAAGE
jgi:hypothetical protein